MDYIPDNDDVTKIGEEVPAGLPVLPVEEAVLEEEITTIAIDNLVAQPTNLNVSNDANKVIHFSDGTMTQAELNMETALGEHDPIESTEQQVALPDNLVEVYRNLGVLGKILTGGSLVTLRVLQAFGTIGESVIDFLGITRPKFEYEINLAKEMQQQEQARNEKIESLYSTWQSSNPSQAPPSTSGFSGPVPPMIPHIPQPPSSLSSMSTLSAALPLSTPSDPSSYAVPLSPPTQYQPPHVQAASVQPPPPFPPQQQAFSTTSFVPPLPPAAVTEPLPVVAPQQSPANALLTTESFSNIPDTPTEAAAAAAETSNAIPQAPEPTFINNQLLDIDLQQPQTQPESTDDVDPK